VALVVDPFNPSTTDVVVAGPAGADTISIVSVGSGRVDVTMNGVTYGPFAPTGRIVAYTGNGNSIVTLGAGITTPAFVFAGTGNDVLINQGTDNSVLVGGGGTDSIQGGSGYNILIGGAGATRLTGGPAGVASGGSVMIGGSTTFNQNEGTLYSMLQDWDSGASYATRMSELSALGMNAANMIPNTLTDQLFASTGQDWYWNLSGHDLISGAHGGTVSV
jgi:Ca2+-binding RTX toxin-like protein